MDMAACIFGVLIGIGGGILFGLGSLAPKSESDGWVAFKTFGGIVLAVIGIALAYAGAANKVSVLFGA